MTGGSPDSPWAQKALQGIQPVTEVVYQTRNRVLSIPHARKILAGMAVILVYAIVHLMFLCGMFDSVFSVN